jgi:hypothetical protein
MAPECVDELIFSIKGCRSRSIKEQLGGAGLDGIYTAGKLPFVTILQVTKEMVEEVYADHPNKIEGELEKLASLHARCSSDSKQRLERVERFLKPGEPWELDRQAKLKNFPLLIMNPLKGMSPFFLSLIYVLFFCSRQCGESRVHIFSLWM